MREIKLAYLPVIGRGEQINIICKMHDIKVEYLLSTPMGNDFDKDADAPFGIVPWMKDKANDLVLNDSMAIVQYLVSKYPGPLTPKSSEDAALTAMYWGWAQDYYSFVLSPFHDIITGHNEAFWRNLRLTDTLTDGGKEKGISNLTKLHKSRFKSLEAHLAVSNNKQFLNGPKCSYADIFLYTCVTAVQKSGGFGILRDACDGEPFADYPRVLEICTAVSKIDKVIESVGSKFTDYPI